MIWWLVKNGWVTYWIGFLCIPECDHEKSEEESDGKEEQEQCEFDGRFDAPPDDFSDYFGGDEDACEGADDDGEEEDFAQGVVFVDVSW